MKLAFLVTNIQTEKATYVTVKMAHIATKRGHEVYFIGIGDLSYHMKEKGEMYAKACVVKNKNHPNPEAYINELHSIEKKDYKKISLDELDVLMLRTDPCDKEICNKSWAKNIGVDFGRLLMRKGVIVLNSPNGLSYAKDKMYLQSFPNKIRPKTIVTKDKDDIKDFFKGSSRMILKPLAGSEGTNVFLIDKKSHHNLNQIVEAVSSDGYIVAQEYLPKAEEGDIRLIMINGEPLVVDGKYAAFKRVAKNGDVRNNVSIGGAVKKVKITKEILDVCKCVRPRLVQDGMFFVGLDIVGDKVLEVNVFNPGGLFNAEKLEGVDFTTPIIEALERKVAYMKDYNRKINPHHVTTM